MLLQEGKIICGTAILTAAYKKANIKDRNWIHSLQERALALYNEFERCTGNLLISNVFYILPSVKLCFLMSKFIEEIIFL
ncbi:hypothetical protein [Bartonella rattimassiliensis]|uniref:Uncharacterized protein n=1 Tax=Bartonella rattimassiliensis 15908 TaxID=1094556 RepID=J0QJ90_9HYPH|nr:hypothetical protein [Bartonella rattimassiliensis]EJF82979.1 hypothetical protein MCY_01500 [Bartonella rattimassiliensis 15908]